MNRRGTRRTGALAVVAISGLALAGCFQLGGGGSAPQAVGFDDVQSATVYIKGQGTFIDPGSVAPAEGRWIGSGFVVSPDGIVLTNNHVVTGAGTLDVFIGGDQSEQVRGTVLGASECLDLAVLQLEGDGFAHLAWLDGEIKTGLDVYSAGYPAGAAEQFTLTRGIVSKNDFALDTQWASLDHVIEHDARIRGGNSGGPLVDGDGRLVGVNYAGDDSLDYNFAIHRDIAQDVIERLAAGEQVDSLGINAKAWVSDDESIAGVWVSSVDAGGPADVAGIEPGDLIYKLAGVSVGQDGTLGQYCQVLRTQGPDATIDVEVYRPSTDELLEGQIEGKTLTVTATNVSGSSTSGGQGTDFENGFVTITDETGTLSVSVPSSWSDVNGGGFVDDAGTSWLAVTAAPSVSAFLESLEVPGIQLFGTTESPDDAGTILANISSIFDGTCSSTATGEEYDDGWYAGVYSEWECGSGTVAIALSTVDSSGYNLVLITQLQSNFELQEGLPEILNTFMASF